MSDRIKTATDRLEKVNDMISHCEWNISALKEKLNAAKEERDAILTERAIIEFAIPNAREWISTSDRMPPQNLPVETKIHDSHGERNLTVLVLNNRLWFSGDMYVYYTPTHWRFCNA